MVRSRPPARYFTQSGIVGSGDGGGDDDSDDDEGGVNSGGNSVVKAANSTPGTVTTRAAGSDLPVIGGIIVQAYITLPGSGR